MNLKISIIVPVYNAEKTLHRCVQSVLQQTYTNWELVLVNDGSKDQSLNLCKEYCIQDSRIKLITQNNKGVSTARNNGIDLASGEYIFFLDGDDAIRSDALTHYSEIICKHSPDIIVGSLICIFQNGEEKVKGPVKEGLFGSEIWNLIAENSEPFGWAGGKCIRKDLLDQKQIRFCPSMKSQEDLAFNLQVYRYASKIYLSKFADYLYFYIPSTRVPPIPDYISNQLKIASFASERVKLEKNAENILTQRIDRLVFTYLYEADSLVKTKQIQKEFKTCDGLYFYLKTHEHSSEKNLIMKLVVYEKYKTIFWYFSIRKCIKNLWVFLKRKNKRI